MPGKKSIIGDMQRLLINHTDGSPECTLLVAIYCQAVQDALPRMNKAGVRVMSTEALNYLGGPLDELVACGIEPDFARGLIWDSGL